MNWADLLPHAVAEQQRIWEQAQARSRKVVALCRAGATLQEVGEALGVSRERARQISRRGLHPKPSPAETYLSAEALNPDIIELAFLLKEAARKQRNQPRLNSQANRSETRDGYKS